MSDLHLHDDVQPYLFTPHKERIFNRVVAEILSREGELVLAGDIFDFTGMTPPRAGLDEFFDEVLPRALRNSPEIKASTQPRTFEEKLSGIERSFPDFFKSLSALAARKKLTIIAGNHDCALNDTRARVMFSDILGAGPTDIRWRDVYTHGTALIAAHGNQFDPPNRTRGTHCTNPGMTMTSVLYRAVLPALRVLGIPEEIAAAIPAVRPEEAVIEGIEAHLGEEQTRRFLIAFVKLLERNHYFSGLQGGLMWLLVHEIPHLSEWVRRGVTPARIREALPNDLDVKMRARRGARLIHWRASRDYRRIGLPPPSLVVLGHTHELDGTDNYVNLGTWIDHLKGIRPEQLRNPDQSLPVLELGPTEDRAILWDARGLERVSFLNQCDKLWEFKSRATAIPAAFSDYPSPIASTFAA